MPEPTTSGSQDSQESPNLDNPSERTTAIHNDPSILLEEGRNANEGKGPNSAGSVASSTAEDYVPSTSDPEPSDLPSAR